MAKKRYYVILVMAVVLGGLLLTGGTYAWLTFSTTVGDNEIVANSTCFIIDYSGDFQSLGSLPGDVNGDNKLNLADITSMRSYVSGNKDFTSEQIALGDSDGDGDLDSDDVEYWRTVVSSRDPAAPVYYYGLLFPSKTAKGGLSGSVTLNINSECSVAGKGTITLNVGSDTGSVLLSEGALKYAVYDSTKTNELASGTLTATGDKTLYTNFSLSTTATTYYVYVWLDGTIADNDYINAPFSGYLRASAVQTES